MSAWSRLNKLVRLGFAQAIRRWFCSAVVVRDVFRIISVVFPGEKCRNGIALSCEAFTSDLIQLQQPCSLLHICDLRRDINQFPNRTKADKLIGRSPSIWI